MSDDFAEYRKAKLEEYKAPPCYQPAYKLTADAQDHQRSLLEHATFSLWRIAEALEENNKLIDRIGLNYYEMHGPPGALEVLGMESKRIADALTEMNDRAGQSDDPWNRPKR